MNNTRHFFLLLSSSEYPILLALVLLLNVSGAVLYFNLFSSIGTFLIKLGFILIFVILIKWWITLMQESYKFHTNRIRFSIKISMMLFIASEFMFFFGFFWAYFHSMLVPVNGIWPPLGIDIINPWHLPLLNTFLLLSSGATLTWSHYEMINEQDAGWNEKKLALWDNTILALALTICLGLSFMFVQAHEYLFANFGMSDGIYGSLFFLLTGFHGFHVFVGLIFLSIVLIRFLSKFIPAPYSSNNLVNSSFIMPEHQTLFDVSAWYWHFVDVIWIFLFIFIYWFGSK